ncbi:MAG: hypothetical protein ACREJQ_02990 [bacterium]
MGRTNETFNMAIEQLFNDKLAKFRRALRKGDQEVFDRLYAYAKQQAQAGTYASFDVPEFGVIFTILLGLAKDHDALKRRLRELQAPAP